MQDLASLARKIFARLEYFLQDGFHWVMTNFTSFHNYFFMEFINIRPVYIRGGWEGHRSGVGSSKCLNNKAR